MKKFSLILLSAIILLSPSLLFAQGYLPLVGLPGLGTGTPSFDSYVETIYAITITVAALLAVIKIVIAGVKWMMTDIVTSKGEAKKDIQGAVVGLLVVLSAVLVIEIINPNINSVDLSIPTQSAPARPPVVAVIPMDPYIPNRAAGYDWIPLDAPVGQANRFRADCVAPETYVRDPGTNQMRCNDAPNAGVVSRMTADLTTGPNPLSASDVTYFMNQYAYYVAPFEITNAGALATIQADNGASGVFFAADMFVPNPGYTVGGTEPQNIIMSQSQIDQFIGLCDTMARAQGLNTTDVGLYVDINRDTNTASCLQP